MDTFVEEGSEKTHLFWAISSLSSRLLQFFSPSSWSSIFRPSNRTTLELSDSFVHQLQSDSKLGLDVGRFLFVLKTQNSQVYLLSTEALSERSVSHVRELIAVVKPEVVVTQVDKCDKWLLESCILEASMKVERMRRDLDNVNDVSCQQVAVAVENKGIESSKSSGGTKAAGRGIVPSKYLDVVSETVTKGVGVSEYKLLVFSELLDSIFGTTFIGRIAAAKQAAEVFNSQFFYLETAIAASLREDSAANLSGAAALGEKSLEDVDIRSIDFLSPVSHLSMLQNSYLKPTRRDGDGRERPSLTSGREKESQNGGKGDTKAVEPFVGQLVETFLQDYVEAFPEVLELKEAHQNVRSLIWLVAEGRLASQGELKGMWYFRQAVETFRIGSVLAARMLPEMNCRMPAGNQGQKKQKVNLTVDMEGLLKMKLEEQQQILIAQALRNAANEKSCVAVMDGLAIRGVLKHWNTPVSADVHQFAESILCSPEAMERKTKTRKQTNTVTHRTDGGIIGPSSANGLLPSEGKGDGDKDAVVTAAAASALAFWASRLGLVYSAAAKIVGFNAPSTLKAMLMVAERGMSVGGLKAIPALHWHWATPMKAFSVAPQTAIPGNLALGAKAAAAGKSTSATGSAVAQTILDSVYRQSFQMGRTAFYGLMNGRKRTTPVRAGRMRGWIMLGTTLAACGAVTVYKDEVERVTAVVPYARSVALMGRGLQGLREASEAARSDTSFWKDRYRKLDCCVWR